MRNWVRPRIGSLVLACVMGLSFGACSSQQQEVEEDLQSEDAGQQGQGGDQQESYGQQQGGEGEYGDADTGTENSYAGAAAEGGTNDLASLVGEVTNPAVHAGANAYTNPAGTDAGLGNPYAAAPTNAAADAAATAVPPGPAPAAGALAMAAPALSIKGAAGMPAGPGLPEMGAKMVYIVEPGDTLANISQKIYGTTARWQELASLSGLPNPDRIYPGDVVYYQLNQEAVAFSSTYEATPKQEITAQAGDSLVSISQAVYGSPKQWKSIWRQNGHIDDPFNIAPGTVVYYLSTSTTSAAIDGVNVSNAPQMVSLDFVKKTDLEKLRFEMQPLQSSDFSDANLAI